MDALEALRPAYLSLGSSSAAASAGPKEEGEAEKKPAAGVGDLLDAELAELRGGAGGDDKEAAGPRKPRIAFYCEVTRGIALVSIPGGPGSQPQKLKVEGDMAENEKAEEQKEAGGGEAGDVNDVPLPTELVHKVFAAHSDSSSGGRVARFVVRMWPLDYVCSPHLKQFQAAAAESLPKAFAGAKEGATWYLRFQARAMSTIKREDALAAIKDIVRPLNLEISVCDAEYMVVVEVNPVLCGFSVMRGYEALHDCNLQALCAAVGRKAPDDEDDDEDEDESEEEDDEGEEAGEDDRPATAAADSGAPAAGQEAGQEAPAAPTPAAPSAPAPASAAESTADAGTGAGGSSSAAAPADSS